MNFVCCFIKKIIIVSFLLYFFNMISVHYYMVLPFNIITIGILSCFDVFGLIGLVVFHYFFL